MLTSAVGLEQHLAHVSSVVHHACRQRNAGQSRERGEDVEAADDLLRAAGRLNLAAPVRERALPDAAFPRTWVAQ